MLHPPGTLSMRTGDAPWTKARKAQAAAMRQVWMLDDTPHWHAIGAASAAQVPGWSFRAFVHSRELFAALAQARSTGEEPQALLMDFYLDGERGDRVTLALRERPDLGRPVVVAHSSMTSGNHMLLSAGCDEHVAKRDVAGLNPDLIAFLRDWPGDPA